MARRPTQKQLYERLLARYSKELADAFFAAIREAASGVSFRQLVAAIDSGNAARVVQVLGLDDAALFPVADALRNAFVAGGASVSEIVPRGARFGFDGRHPRAEAWVAEQAGTMIQNITDDTLPAVRAAVLDGIERGRSSDAVARDIVGRVDRVTGRRKGGIIGLHGGLEPPNAEYPSGRVNGQVGSSFRARAELEDLDSNYFNRKLRDRRFDKMVQRSIDEGEPLSKTDIDRITGRYNDRMLKYRGDMVARTEAHGALSSGQHEGFQQAIDSGKIKSASKAWVHNSANQDEREDHVSLSMAPAIPFDQAFVLPDGTRMQYAHDPAGGAKHNIFCRCTTRYQVEV